LMGTHPVLLMFLELVELTQEYAHPDAMIGRLRSPQVEEASGIEAYMVLVLPREKLEAWDSVLARIMALLRVSMSENLVASRDWANSSTGLMIMVVTAANTPKIATTTRSSIRVKP